MNHWHLIYTRKELEDLQPCSVPYDNMSASAEMGQGGRHWHIYIKDGMEDKIRDTLKAVQKIPAGKRGNKSLYYSLRPVAEKDPEHPETDFRKFTLGYTLKNWNESREKNEDHFHTGYTFDDLIEAKRYYEDTTNKRYKPPAPVSAETMAQLHAIPDGIQGEWADCVVYFEKILKPQIVGTKCIPMEFIKSHARKFWRTKYKQTNGLLPLSPKYKRFLASIVDMFRANLNIDERLQVMKDCGYP